MIVEATRAKLSTKALQRLSVRRHHEHDIKSLHLKTKYINNHHPEMIQQQRKELKDWMEARKEFGEAVASVLQDLLRQGFSRERATSVILQEIGVGHEKPSDEQVSLFDTSCLGYCCVQVCFFSWCTYCDELSGDCECANLHVSKFYLTYE